MLTTLTVIAIISLAVTVYGVYIKAAAAGELVLVLNDALDINKMEGLKLFDTPYMNITSNALGMIVNFMEYARLLVCICAFLALIFNASIYLVNASSKRVCLYRESPSVIKVLDLS